MFSILRRRRNRRNAAQPGQHIFVWLNASESWHYAIYDAPLSEGRHLVHVYVDGDWYPVAVCTEDLDLSTWGWA
jgi:NAD(P)H-flavin reductase